MKVKRQDLLGALDKVKVGLSDKAIIEQTDHFIFADNYVRTYNDQIAISHPFTFGFDFAIKAGEFHKLLSKLTGEEIDFQMSDGQLNFVSGKSKGQIVISSEIKCPDMLVDDTKKWQKLPKDFSEGLRFCSFSADKNMLMQELTCLWINGDNIVSSDNWRATKYNMESKIKNAFLLPASVAEKLWKYSPSQYILEDAWAHFKNEEIIFSCRIVAGKFPEGISFDVQGDSVLLPSGLSESIDRARVLITKNEDDLITLSVKDGKIFCKGEGVLGWIEEEHFIRCRKSFEIKVAPEALIEILSRTDKMVVSENKLYFSGDKFEHIICVN